MTIDIGKPSPRQTEFLLANTKHIAFGGARGGGKSWAVRAKAKLLALRYPGIRILIVRRTYPELVNNHINILVPELNGIAKYNKSEKIFVFGNGSTIKLGYCQSDSDILQYQGAEYDIICLEEATQLSEHQMRTITACLRGANDFPKRMYYTCNPGGQGHQYIKRLFIDRRYEAEEIPEEYTFIKSLVTDNEALMKSQPDYVNQLEALPPKLRKAWLEGDWNIFEGQFFEEFKDDPDHYEDRKYTHVIKPFDVPSHWKIYRSFDWGFAKPFSTGYWAIPPKEEDEDGTVYRILEYYGCTKTPNEGLKQPPQQVFTDMKKLENEHPWLRGKNILGVADPAIWDAQSGESIAETAAKCGIYFAKGDHARLPGWMQFHYRLQFSDTGKPRMYIFSNCKAFIRTIPTLQYDDHKVEDLDTEGEDHVADEVRYLLMTRPIAPRLAKEDDAWESNPLHQIFGFTREDLAYSPSEKTLEVY